MTHHSASQFRRDTQKGIKISLREMETKSISGQFHLGWLLKMTEIIPGQLKQSYLHSSK